MEKIVIIGSPGTGKSTLACKLGEILNIEVFHLDRYFWNSNWNEIPRPQRLKIQAKLIQKPEWIIEGAYLRSSDERLLAADTVIFLDMPSWLCFWRVIKRRIQYHNKTRPDLPAGCTEKLHLSYLVNMLVFPFKKRTLLKQKIERLLYSREIQYLCFKSSQEVVNFLLLIASKPYLPEVA